MTGRLRDWIIGGLILTILIYWVETRIGWQALLAPWKEVSPLQLIYLFALSLLSYVFRAVRIYDYFHHELKGNFMPTLRLSVLHNFANNLLPMRAGEAAFPILMKRYFGQSMANSALSLLWIRGLDLHFLIFIALSALYLRENNLLWPIAAILWLSTLLLVYPLRKPLLELCQQQQNKLTKILNKILINLPSQQNGFYRAYLWTSLTWISKFIAFAVVLLHFLEVPLWQAVMGIMGSELSSILPFHGVAGAGSYEVGMVAVLAPMGVDADAVVGGAVNLHLFLLGVTLLLGVLAMLLPKPTR